MQPRNELALDFLNALGARLGDPDSVTSPARLLDWLDGQGLATRRLGRLRASPAESALLLTEAARLAAATEKALEALRSGEAVPQDALHAIDRALSASTVRHRLLAGPGGPRLEREEEGRDLRAALAPLASGAAELVTEADPGRLRRCAASDCRAWFLDTSKGGRRKWCSMARCGNRAKAARHRRRRRVAGAPTA